jgi:hypothetical protein
MTSLRGHAMSIEKAESLDDEWRKVNESAVLTLEVEQHGREAQLLPRPAYATDLPCRDVDCVAFVTESAWDSAKRVAVRILSGGSD